MTQDSNNKIQIPVRIQELSPNKFYILTDNGIRLYGPFINKSEALTKLRSNELMTQFRNKHAEDIN